jgi:hypothetical protein
MANDFYAATGIPANNSQGASSAMRSEFAAIENGFDKLPIVTGNANKVVVVNAGGTGLEAKTLGASSVSNTPAGGISATTVQAAIDELDTEKAPKANPSFTGTIWSDGGLELTGNATGNRNSVLDFHADDTNVDYSARVLRNQGVNGNFDLTNAGTGLVRVINGGSLRMAIDSTGYVYMDNQPACVASRNIGSWEVLAANTSYGILGTFTINRGGFYSGGTVGAGGQALHVPATGYYSITLSLYIQSSTGCRVYLYKNNSTVIGSLLVNSTTGDRSLSRTFIASLTAGDYINYKIGVSGNATLFTAYDHTDVSIRFLG